MPAEVDVAALVVTAAVVVTAALSMSAAVPMAVFVAMARATFVSTASLAHARDYPRVLGHVPARSPGIPCVLPRGSRARRPPVRDLLRALRAPSSHRVPLDRRSLSRGHFPLGWGRLPWSCRRCRSRREATHRWNQARPSPISSHHLPLVRSPAVFFKTMGPQASPKPQPTCVGFKASRSGIGKRPSSFAYRPPAGAAFHPALAPDLHCDERPAQRDPAACVSALLGTRASRLELHAAQCVRERPRASRRRSREGLSGLGDSGGIASPRAGCSVSRPSTPRAAHPGRHATTTIRARAKRHRGPRRGGRARARGAAWRARSALLVARS